MRCVAAANHGRRQQFDQGRETALRGKHDKATDPEAKSELLLTGPIAIRGLGRATRDFFRPDKVTKHRADGDQSADPDQDASGEGAPVADPADAAVTATSERGAPEPGADAAPERRPGNESSDEDDRVPTAQIPLSWMFTTAPTAPVSDPEHLTAGGDDLAARPRIAAYPAALDAAAVDRLRSRMIDRKESESVPVFGPGLEESSLPAHGLEDAIHNEHADEGGEQRPGGPEAVPAPDREPSGATAGDPRGDASDEPGPAAELRDGADAPISDAQETDAGRPQMHSEEAFEPAEVRDASSAVDQRPGERSDVVPVDVHDATEQTDLDDSTVVSGEERSGLESESPSEASLDVQVRDDDASLSAGDRLTPPEGGASADDDPLDSTAPRAVDEGSGEPEEGAQEPGAGPEAAPEPAKPEAEEAAEAEPLKSPVSDDEDGPEREQQGGPDGEAEREPEACVAGSGPDQPVGMTADPDSELRFQPQEQGAESARSVDGASGARSDPIADPSPTPSRPLHGPEPEGESQFTPEAGQDHEPEQAAEPDHEAEAARKGPSEPEGRAEKDLLPDLDGRGHIETGTTGDAAAATAGEQPPVESVPPRAVERDPAGQSPERARVEGESGELVPEQADAEAGGASRDSAEAHVADASTVAQEDDLNSSAWAIDRAPFTDIEADSASVAGGMVERRSVAPDQVAPAGAEGAVSAETSVENGSNLESHESPLQAAEDGSGPDDGVRIDETGAQPVRGDLESEDGQWAPSDASDSANDGDGDDAGVENAASPRETELPHHVVEGGVAEQTGDAAPADHASARAQVAFSAIAAALGAVAVKGLVDGKARNADRGSQPTDGAAIEPAPVQPLLDEPLPPETVPPEAVPAETVPAQSGAIGSARVEPGSHGPTAVVSEDPTAPPQPGPALAADSANAVPDHPKPQKERPGTPPRPPRAGGGGGAWPWAYIALGALTVVCLALVIAVVVKTRHDADIAAREAAAYTPPPLSTPISTPTPTPVATLPVVSVVGDQLTAGTSADSGTKAEWPALLATALKADVKTYATNGAGYITQGSGGATVLTEVGRVDPSSKVVVLFGGTNDASNSALALAAAATKAVSTAHTRVPQAKIVLIGPASGLASPPQALTSVRDTLRSVAGIGRATFVDPIAGNWLSSSPALTDANGNPTDAGQRTMESKIAAILKGLVT